MLSQIKRARGHLAAVRAQMLSTSPEEVEQCIPALHEAIACLRAVEPRQELAGELRALHFELGVVSRLAQHGAEFYQNWAQVLASAATGYTAAGNAAALTAAGSLSVKG